MEIRPDYYDKFKCIADKCEHNCCIGWEIDIDEASLKKYKKQVGLLKEKLDRCISAEPCAHFVLADNERCPFLNDKNLCELILEGGEEMLCQICSDHPRFYNEIDDITEKGIGLSCEAAAKIILTKTEPTCLLSDSKELPKNDFYLERNEIFSLLQNREKPLFDRIAEILAKVGAPLPVKMDWISIYKGLERLDPMWDELLDSVDSLSFTIPKSLETSFEQLLHYFIYRHLSGSLNDFMFEERIQFAIISCFLIASLCKTESLDELCDIARMYSAEIEYSDENIEVLLDKLSEYNEK